MSARDELASWLGILGLGHSLVEGERIVQYWRARAAGHPEWAVRSVAISDTLGGHMVFVGTDAAELLAQVHYPTREEILARCTSPEDSGARDALLRLLHPEKPNP